MVDGFLKGFQLFSDDQDDHKKQYCQPVPCIPPDNEQHDVDVPK